MNKRYALHKLYEFGDAFLSMKDGRSFLATTDFKNKYIRRIRRNRNDSKDLKGKLIVFNWTDNVYEAIYSNDIIYMTPLGKVLNNEPRDIS